MEASSAVWVIDRGPVTERSSPPRTMLISTKIECGQGNNQSAQGWVEGQRQGRDHQLGITCGRMYNKLSVTISGRG